MGEFRDFLAVVESWYGGADSPGYDPFDDPEHIMGPGSPDYKFWTDIEKRIKSRKRSGLRPPQPPTPNASAETGVWQRGDTTKEGGCKAAIDKLSSRLERLERLLAQN